MTSKTVTINCQNGNSGYQLYVEANLTGKIKGNTREVSCKFQINPINSGGFYAYSENPVHTSLVAAGVSRSYNEWGELWPRNSWKTVNSWTGYITAGQTITVTGNLTLRSDYSSGYSYLPTAGSVSVNLTLAALQSSLGEIEDFVFDENENTAKSFSVPVTKYDENFYNILRIKNSNTLIAERNGFDGGNITLSEDELTTAYQSMKTVKSAVWTFLLETYASAEGSKIGENSATATASIADTDSSPVFSESAISACDTNLKTTALTGNDQKYIKGYSDVCITLSSHAVAKKGAEIISYTFAANGYADQNAEGSCTVPVSKTFEAAKASAYQVIATDSRGNSTEFSAQLELIDYKEPVLNELRVDRVSPPYTGTTANITLNANISSWERYGLATENAVESLKYRCKSSQGSEYTEYTVIEPEDITITDNGISSNVNIAGPFAISDEYIFEVVLTDKLSSSLKTAKLNSAQPTVDIDVEKRIIAVGKTIEGSTECSLELGTPLSPKYGGSGRSSLTQGHFLIGNGTNAVQTKDLDEVSTLLGLPDMQKKPVLLWENASPTSAFSNQSLDLENNQNYSFFLVELKSKAGKLYSHLSLMPNRVGYDEYLLALDRDSWFGYRHAAVTNTGLIFYNGGYVYLGELNESSNNNYGIPTNIWGV